MLTIRETSQFKKAFKKILKSGIFKSKDRIRFENVLNTLVRREKLTAQFHDHEMVGSLLGNRECHIKPNLLLIYRVENEELVLILVNIGSHSELFG